MKSPAFQLWRGKRRSIGNFQHFSTRLLDHSSRMGELFGVYFYEISNGQSLVSPSVKGHCETILAAVIHEIQH
jgi:hypothetical protein